MADDFCKNLLEDWDLKVLIPRFEDNGIDEETIKNLTSDIIKELVPHIGNRIKFTNKWTKKFIKVGQDQNVSSLSDNGDTTENLSPDDDSDGESENTDPNIVGCSGHMNLNNINRPNVKRMLESSMEGIAILQKYKKTKTLSRGCRNMVVNLVISQIFKDVQSVRSFRVQELETIAKEIVQVFPSEVLGTYYVPPIRKSKSRMNKSISCRGKLVDKFRNKKRDYKRLTGWSIADDSSSTSTETSEPGLTMETEENLEIQASVSWLQQNQAPWEMVLSHWRAISGYRQNKILNSKAHNVCDVFEQWPILRHPKGHELIDEDFKALKLSENPNAIIDWPVFFEKIEKMTELRTNPSNESHNLLKTDELNIDSKVAVQLSLLPYLIPPKGRVRTKKDHWKPSITECLESLIVHAKNPGDVSHIQQKRIEAMDRVKLTVQPYIIVVGPSLKEISTFYVCIDKTLYAVSSTLKAIDTCFKSFHVLDATYPPESEHIWMLIQCGLYKFHTKYDKQISYVMELINTLKK